jgi:hypothetical protein
MSNPVVGGVTFSVDLFTEEGVKGTLLGCFDLFTCVPTSPNTCVHAQQKDESSIIQDSTLSCLPGRACWLLKDWPLDGYAQADCSITKICPGGCITYQYLEIYFHFLKLTKEIVGLIPHDTRITPMYCRGMMLPINKKVYPSTVIMEHTMMGRPRCLA